MSSSPQRRLGRGLEALLGRPVAAPGQTVNIRVADEPPIQPMGEIDVKLIDTNPFQPRKEFGQEELVELAMSLEEHGMIQPIVVRQKGDRYELIAGERRLRAARRLSWTTVPAQIRDADDRQMAEIAIVENLQRKDLNPLEKAASFEQYLTRYNTTQEELAGRLKIDRSTIANLIRLLELPALIQDAIRSSAISQGHARALLPLGEEREQLDLCERIIEEQLSVRATESLVQEMIHHADAEPLSIAGRAAAKPGSRRPDANLAALEQELKSALGAKVQLRQTAKGRGRIVIHFANHEEFERIREQLRGNAPSPSAP